MEDNESCGSGIHHRTSSSIPAQSRQQRQKVEVYNEILRRLKDSGNEEAMQPGFDDQLWNHFNRLPSRSFSYRISSLHLRVFHHFFVNVLLFLFFVITFIWSFCSGFICFNREFIKWNQLRFNSDFVFLLLPFFIILLKPYACKILNHDNLLWWILWFGLVDLEYGWSGFSSFIAKVFLV